MSRMIEINGTTNESTLENEEINIVSFLEFDWSLDIRAFVSAVGIFTNLINILVFMNSKLKDHCYKILLVKSVTNCAYSLFTFLAVFLSFCDNCAPKYSYFGVVYTIWMNFFLLSSFAMLRIFLEVLLSVRTLLILNKMKWFGRYKIYIVFVILAVLSIGINAYKPFKYGFIKLGNNFILVYTDFGISKLNTIFTLCQSITRAFFASIVLTVINFFNIRKFRRLFKCSLILPIKISSLEAHKATSSSNFFINLFNN